jgi:hypothetical protein
MFWRRSIVDLYALFWNMGHVFGLEISKYISAELKVCSFFVMLQDFASICLELENLLLLIVKNECFNWINAILLLLFY